MGILGPAGSGGGGGTAGQIQVGNVVFVDAVVGNDATAKRGTLGLPFKTVTAAVAAASAGDTIQIGPGTFNEGTNQLVLPAGVGIAGAGVGSWLPLGARPDQWVQSGGTTIISSLGIVSANTVNPVPSVIVPGDGFFLRDFTVVTSLTGGQGTAGGVVGNSVSVAAIGFWGGGSTNAGVLPANIPAKSGVIRNVQTIGWFAGLGLYGVNGMSAVEWAVENCNFGSNWNSIVLGDDGTYPLTATLDIWDTFVTSTWNGTDGGVTSFYPLLDNCGANGSSLSTINLHSGDLFCNTNSSGGNASGACAFSFLLPINLIAGGLIMNTNGTKIATTFNGPGSGVASLYADAPGHIYVGSGFFMGDAVVAIGTPLTVTGLNGQLLMSGQPTVTAAAGTTNALIQGNSGNRGYASDIKGNITVTIGASPITTGALVSLTFFQKKINSNPVVSGANATTIGLAGNLGITNSNTAGFVLSTGITVAAGSVVSVNYVDP